MVIDRSRPKIVLFRPMSDEYQEKVRHAPWGLMYVAAPLVAEGYDVQIIDAPNETDWKGAVASVAGERPLCFGITAMTGYQIRQGLECARLVRELCDARIVWGGVHPTLLPLQTLENPWVDFVVKGEGEQTMLQLVKALSEGKAELSSIEGLCFKRDGELVQNADRDFLNLNALLPVPFDLVQMERYLNSDRNAGYSRMAEVSGSRGCPHKCGFCYNVKFNKRKWRCRDVNLVIDDIKYMVDRFGIDAVNWREDNFFVRRERVAQLCERVIDEEMNIKWRGNCRCDYFVGYDDDFITLLSESGCILLSFGIESGSQRMLDEMEKGITVEQIVETAHRLKHHGIAAGFQVMIGFPGEQEEDRRATYSLLYELSRKFPRIQLQGPSVFTPYPGCTLYERSIELGFSPPDSLESWGKFSWARSRLPCFSQSELRRMEASSRLIHKAYSRHRLTRLWGRVKFYLLHKFNIAFAPARYLSPIAHAVKYTIRKALRRISNS